MCFTCLLTDKKCKQVEHATRHFQLKSSILLVCSAISFSTKCTDPLYRNHMHNGAKNITVVRWYYAVSTVRFFLVHGKPASSCS